MGQTTAKEILGQKIGMSRVFTEAGEAVPVTVIEAGPCPVIAVKTIARHGYDGYQVGFGVRHKNRVTKPLAGQFAGAKVEPTQYLREIRCDIGELKIGSVLKVGMFKVGERIDVTGVSRGLGFAGSMKRHHFSGGQKTHGQSDRMRAPGSIGQSSYPSRVFKGMRMAGRMGNRKVTTLNLEIVDIIENENLMLVKGAVPGFRGKLVKIRSTNRG
ncbi:MAG: 50S ribosomal protein L3 [candidate division Zixibacteria bacterium]|jgi:large subunit ribosomal protein L3|nr:50S ribosomal protein L3 [candidate division Zixibacteria bacterium]MCK4606539.1 50S ribosomal protein L3 [candidate division Zixibacteria bacterium]